jgi:hypothetical protein
LQVLAQTQLPLQIGLPQDPWYSSAAPYGLLGQAVTLDILQNPSTGEKIYDVLRPIAGSAPVMSVESVPARETISRNRITLRVNGKSMPAPSSVVMGEAVRIDIPRQSNRKEK